VGNLPPHGYFARIRRSSSRLRLQRTDEAYIHSFYSTSRADLIVRFASALTDCLSTPHSAASPFSLVNAPNVQLETIKRAEDDDHSSNKATIIIRMFEQLGGHAKPVLKMYVCSALWGVE
jgi:alpha-mannosidase